MVSICLKVNKACPAEAGSELHTSALLMVKLARSTTCMKRLIDQTIEGLTFEGSCLDINTIKKVSKASVKDQQETLNAGSCFSL